METGYYVSMIRAQRVALLLGPYPEHETAKRLVPLATRLACAMDIWADFYSFGTCRRTPADRQGILHRFLPLPVRAPRIRKALTTGRRTARRPRTTRFVKN